jgi:Ca2+-binding RTX toxin-like protein
MLLQAPPGPYAADHGGSPGLRMMRRGQGVVVALAVILGISLVAGGIAVLAHSGGSTRVHVFIGNNKPNRLIGTPARDVIKGLRAGDTMKGRGGSDLLKGARGPDTLDGGKGYDRIHGGRGNDHINARDGHLDLVDCGPGQDTAIVDRSEDGVFDCEHVKTPKSFEGSPK